MNRTKAFICASALGLATVWSLSTPSPTVACGPEPITVNTPSGISGCYQWGIGKASTYGASGFGVAMNFCTWGLRHSDGCGRVSIKALDTGLKVVAPVIDFCDCYWLTDRRLVDMLPGVVAALGLDRARGIWQVDVEPLDNQSGASNTPPAPALSPVKPVTDLPNTSI